MHRELAPAGLQRQSGGGGSGSEAAAGDDALGAVRGPGRARRQVHRQEGRQQRANARHRIVAAQRKRARRGRVCLSYRQLTGFERHALRGSALRSWAGHGCLGRAAALNANTQEEMQ